METLWFALCALMIAIYVVMDGFDFGSGILHPFIAKTDHERRLVLQAIGPYWDGNEVWLLAGGGVLFIAFTKALGAGLSGFYLPIMLVLWSLILRGLSIELRSHHPGLVWRSFWDGGFFIASALLPILLGAALGNLIRGVPLEADGYFTMPLWTNFLLSQRPGILDWYTVLVGLFALVAVTVHGALFLIWKLHGHVQTRLKQILMPLWGAMLFCLALVTLATLKINPGHFAAVWERPLAWLCVALFSTALVAIPFLFRKGYEFQSFLASGIFLLGLLGATAAGAYPKLLRSTLNPAWSLTAQNTANSPYSLSVGLWWWFLGVPLALLYFAYVFRIHRGKVDFQEGEKGY